MVSMVGEKVVDEFCPPVDADQGDLKADEILEVIREHGCSYPSEICGETDISKETVYRKLRYLTKQKVIKRMNTAGMIRVPDWLQHRIPDLWFRGITGNNLKRLSWYMVVEEDGESKKDPAKLK